MGKKLTLLGFSALTISMVMDVYEYPIFATAGFSLIFYLIVGGLLWFIPTALCSAEMATVAGWQSGGVFAWVKNTLGERYGFVAVFLQWFQTTIGFIAMLYFIISALAHALQIPELNNNPVYKFVCLLIIFWLVTFFNFKGTTQAQILAKFGSICGIIIPAVLLFGLSIIYLVSGHPSQLNFHNINIIPNFSQPATLVVFISFLLSYMGIEASASYVNELDNPKRNYPVALILVVLVTIIVNAIGGLSIANVLDQSQLSLSGGIIQGFEILLGSSLGFIAKIVAILLALGVITEISAWVIGPARGMYVAAQKGLLPPVFRKVNSNNVPVYFIIFQGIIVTIWAAILTLLAGGSNLAFTIAISLTVVVYLVMYLLFYLAYLKFNNRMNDIKRGYSFGSKYFKNIVALIGFITSILALIISFIPPANLNHVDSLTYQLILYFAFIVSIILPFIIYHFHDKSKHQTLLKSPRHFKAEEANFLIQSRVRGEHHIDPFDEDYL